MQSCLSLCFAHSVLLLLDFLPLLCFIFMMCCCTCDKHLLHDSLNFNP